MKAINRTLWALVPASAAAAVTVPLAMLERGRWGIGGEWLLVALVFIGVYFMEVRHDND